MKYGILIFLTLISATVYGQYVPFGATRAQDTSKTVGSLYSGGQAIIKGLATNDTNKVLKVDSYGKIILGNTSASGVTTSQLSDSVSTRVKYTDTASMLIPYLRTVNAKNGTVTSITAGSGLSGGTVTTSGTFTNNLITGLSGGQTVIGGTAATDLLTFKSTTGNQTSGNAFTWTGGNNGGTTLMTIDYSGKLGIGYTAPSAKLSVAGTTLINTNTDNGTDKLQVSGSANISTNLTVGGLTAGSVPFIGTSGLISQNNSNLFWDNTNKRLGIGTNSPTYPFHLSGSVAGGTGLNLLVQNSDSTGCGQFVLQNNSSVYAGVTLYGSAYAVTGLRNSFSFQGQKGVVLLSNSGVASGGTDVIKLITGGYNNNPTITITSGNPGKVLIATTTDNGVDKLQVNGSAYINGTLNLPVNTPSISTGTNTRFTINEPGGGPPSDTGFVAQFSSGNNTRNMLFAFTKTGVTTNYFGTDGTNYILGAEKTTADFIFAKGLSYSSSNILASGTTILTLKGSTGNLLLNTTTDNGTDKLQVNGSANISTIIKSPTHTHTVLTYATLPTPVAGMVCYISDAAVNTWGASVTTGGGTNKVLIWYNGTNWTVIGI